MSSLTIEQGNRLKKLAAAGSISLAITLIILKTLGVILTGSLSVLSSMIDSLADLFASSITYIAVRYSSKPASTQHRYGYGKAESLSALIQSAFVAGSGIFVMYDGIVRFFSPRPMVQVDIGIIIMVISLALTIALISFQKYVSKKTHSQAINADSQHYTVDVISNASIILTLFVVKIFEITWFDTLTAFLIAAYLLLNAYKLANEALGILLDKELDNQIRENIQKIVLGSEHAHGIHDLRTRDLGGVYMFEFHLELDGNLPLHIAHDYCDEVEANILKEYPDAQIIIHQDPAGLAENRLDNRLHKN